MSDVVRFMSVGGRLASRETVKAVPNKMKVSNEESQKSRVSFRGCMIIVSLNK